MQEKTPYTTLKSTSTCNSVLRKKAGVPIEAHLVGIVACWAKQICKGNQPTLLPRCFTSQFCFEKKRLVAYRDTSDGDSDLRGKTDLQGKPTYTTSTATSPCNSVLTQNSQRPTEALLTGIPTHKAKQICKRNHPTQLPLPHLRAILF